MASNANGLCVVGDPRERLERAPGDGLDQERRRMPLRPEDLALQDLPVPRHDLELHGRLAREPNAPKEPREEPPLRLEPRRTRRIRGKAPRARRGRTR